MSMQDVAQKNSTNSNIQLGEKEIMKNTSKLNKVWK
jgi:hypothetical protein